MASKPGEFTPDQIVAEMAQNQMKINRAMARILEMFDWYSTSRLAAVIGHFEHQLGADNLGERWRQALLDFFYHNVCFNLKQLIEILHCDLQVTIHEGLVEVQADILEAIANFVDNFHSKVTTLSAPQVHALLDHMHARHAGSNSFFAAIKLGTTLTRPESFLWNGPAQLLQSFFDRLPDHQTDIKRGSTHPTQMESEVNPFSRVLQICIVDVTSNPALMLDFKSGIKSVPTIDLTMEEAVLHYPPFKGNIAEDPEDDLDVPTTALVHSSHQHTVHVESFSSVVPVHTDSVGAQAVPSTSVLRNIPTASFIMDKQEFSPESINRLKALMSKESRTQTLIKAGIEEATKCFDAHTSQDEASYDGDISKVDKEDVEAIPDEVDAEQTEGSKLAGANTFPDNEGQEVTNKGDDGKTSKSTDKKPVQKCSNRASSGS